MNPEKFNPLGEVYQATTYYNGKRTGEGFGFKSFHPDEFADYSFADDLQTVVGYITQGDVQSRNFLNLARVEISLQKDAKGSSVHLRRPMGSEIPQPLEDLAIQLSKVSIQSQTP